VDGDVLVAMVADVDDDDVAPARADGRRREARSGQKKLRTGTESREGAGFSSSAAAAAAAEDLSGSPRLERKGTKKRSRRLALNRRWRKPNRGCQDGARTEADPRELSRRTSPSDHSGTASRMGSHASEGEPGAHPIFFAK